MRNENRYLRDHMIGRDRRNRDYSRGDYRMMDRGRRDYRMNDYARDYRKDERYDYNDYDDYDYAEMDENYKMDLEEWAKDLKRKSHMNMTKNEILNKAKQMSVHFDNYDETEFYVTTMMLMSDFPNIAQPETYIVMAKQWLEDDDVELSGSEKLCAYYYTIVKGE